MVFITYGVIPLIVIAGVIIYIANKDPDEELTMNKKQIFNYDYGSDFYLFQNASNFEDIKFFLSNTSLVVNDNDLGNKLVQYIKEEMNLTLKLYSKENQLNNHSQNVVILDYDSDKDSYKFTYKEKEVVNFNTSQNFPFYTSLLSSQTSSDVFKYEYDNKYFMTDLHNKRFIKYQAFFAKFLIKKVKGKDINKDIHFDFGLNSYPESVKNPRNYDTTEVILSYIITMQFTLVFLSFGVQMLEEKEQKLEKLLERQGINHIKYLLSWFINYIIVSLLSNIASLIGGFQILQSFWGIYVLDLILFNLGLFSLLLFFVTISKNKKVGLILINLFGFGSLVFGYILTQGSPHKAIQILFNFLPNANLFCSIKLITKLQFLGRYSLDNIRLNYNGVNYLDTLIMFIAEIILFIFLSLFIRAYQNSGLNFIYFIKSIFTKVSRNDEAIFDSKEEIPQTKYHEELNEKNQSLKDQNLYLNIRNVTRKYDELVAVNNFNGELFKNEIFCLLGHNGAGKTTLIKMISGAEDPDAGDIFLNNISVVTNKKYLFNNIGLCQQEDIFFDYLTVYEHLKYMMEIKGIKSDLQQISLLMNKIGLAEKQAALCKTLSGGEKRKLCVALALIGNSELVLLDEPTSGMDIISKRALWDFLKEFKNNKIIILTTHSLDEAEYLGDRIGIMTDGQYICCGSSSYLKSKYPCGFNINLLINSSIFNEDYKNQFFNEILKYEPKAEIKVASKAIFSVNIQSNNKNINHIFDYIEQSKNQFGIEDYTVGSTSLEDVFLKINNKANLNDQKYVNNDNQDQLNDIKNIVPTTSSFCTQLGAHICRNLYPFYRNKALFFFELLSGLGVVYIFIFFFADFFVGAMTTTLDLIEVLDANKIYIHTKGTEKKFFKNSDTYDRYGKYITLSEIKEDPNDIEHFMKLAYDEALANIAKGSINVQKEIKTDEIGSNFHYYKVFNTEVNTNKFGYIYGNILLFVSAFLKESYNIDATIMHKITFKSAADNADKLSNVLTDSIILIIVCLINFFGFVIFLGGLMLEKIKEKRTNIKHLLYLSGNNLFSYWLGFYITDYIKLLIFSILLIAPVYTINGCATYFGLDMLLINISALSFIYFITFFCSKDDEGAKFLFIFVFGVLIIIVLIAIAFPDDVAELFDLQKPYVPTILDITPVTSMAFSFIRLILSYSFITEMEKILGDNGERIQESFGFKRPEKYLYSSYIAQLLNIAFYSLLLILAESGLLSKLSGCFQHLCYDEKDIDKVNINPNNNNEVVINYGNNISNNNPRQNLDFNFGNENLNGNPLQNPYVQSEIRKVNDSQKELTTRIINVTKTFYPCCACCRKGKVRAINHLHLGLEPNEKFGLLGFNGSGKTTTFRAITNEITTDAGSINIFGYDTKKQFNYIRTIIGYCPQINPLFDFMKVKEIIEFYSKLKTCNESAEVVCEKFGLSKYLDSYTVNLSGGNKRKLTFAIAMMNRPSLLLLDEPSTGVDPESRRIMWKNINELSNTGHKYNMILTTHSMEEAEILCDTVSWFRAGNFITLGNPEELKLKYSAGYKLHIKFDEMKIKSQADDDMENSLNILANYIEGFNNYIDYFNKNPMFGPYLKPLINVIKKIRNKTSKISLYIIGKDYSFELIIQIINEKKKELFSEILSMKNNDKTIDELTITMQSLENILTSI